MLYNVYRHKNPGKGELVMTAPLGVIWHVFKMHRDAILRVERELSEGAAVSTVHFNGRSPLPGLSLEAIDITK